MQKLTCKQCGKNKPATEFYRCYNRKYDKYYYIYCCKECRREKARKWQQDNRVYLHEYAKKYREENGERVRAYSRKSYYKHANAIAQRRRAYRETIKGRKRWLEYKHKRRHNIGTASQEELRARWLAFGKRCRYCNIKLTFAETIFDHAMPISKGGTDWPSNRVPACARCNKQKYNLTVAEFLIRKEVAS